MEAETGRQHRLKISLYSNVTSRRRMEQLRFLITQKTDYVRLQLWTRTEAHIHFRLEMPAEDAFVSVAAFDSNKQLIVRAIQRGGLYGIDCTDGNKTVTFAKSIGIPIFLILMWIWNELLYRHK